PRRSCWVTWNSGPSTMRSTSTPFAASTRAGPSTTPCPRRESRASSARRRTRPPGPQFQTWLNNCAAFAPQTIKNAGNNWEYNMTYLGPNWDMGLFGYPMGNPLLAPNPPYPNCRTCQWLGDWDCPGMYGLSSFHPGGCNVGMADGSVRFQTPIN